MPRRPEPLLAHERHLTCGWASCAGVRQVLVVKRSAFRLVEPAYGRYVVEVFQSVLVGLVKMVKAELSGTVGHAC